MKPEEDLSSSVIGPSRRREELAMLSLSGADPCGGPWGPEGPEGPLALEEEVVSGEVKGQDSSVALDDSLTSLQWLQDFSILDASAPQHVHAHTHVHQLGADAPASPLAGDPASSTGTPPPTPGAPTAAAYSRIVAHGHCVHEVDYRSDAHVKPPYSYATLICMAMQASRGSKITLSCIYKWITDNFCYYRHADPTWQVRSRHVHAPGRGT